MFFQISGRGVWGYNRQTGTSLYLFNPENDVPNSTIMAVAYNSTGNRIYALLNVTGVGYRILSYSFIANPFSKTLQTNVLLDNTKVYNGLGFNPSNPALPLISTNTTNNSMIFINPLDGTSTTFTSLPINRKLEGEITGMEDGGQPYILVQNRDLITGTRYLTQYTNTGSLQFDIPVGTFTQTGMFALNNALYLVDSSKNIYNMKKDSPYSVRNTGKTVPSGPEFNDSAQTPTTCFNVRLGQTDPIVYGLAQRYTCPGCVLVPGPDVLVNRNGGLTVNNYYDNTVTDGYIYRVTSISSFGVSVELSGAGNASCICPL